MTPLPPNATVAFIPMRGGSKGIPGKNIKPLAGKPMCWWVLEAAVGCARIDRVFVATDDRGIGDAARALGSTKIEVVGRSPETATDTASTESALLEFARNVPCERIVLIQATSPLLRSEDLDEAFRTLDRTGADTLLSVVRQKRFTWKTTANGLAEPVNYVPLKRPRRQEFDGFLVENGAFYVMKRSGLLETNCRLHGTTAAVEMPEESYIELDELSDWEFMEAVLSHRTKTAPAAPVKIRLFVTDVDGVLTDAGMYYTETGDELKKFNTRDGLGLRLMREAGIVAGIITTENTKIVARRAEKLKLDFVHQGAHDKLAVLKQLCAERDVPLSEVAYIGDDVNDLECLKAVGWSACPADAVPAVQSVVRTILKTPGGRGAVREFAERVLAAR